jgi:glyoxylase-like metal-dependent hydrolase (beta-lactamase superfamily II)
VSEPIERTEVAPGVHRLAWAVGAKPMALYLLASDRLVLVDTGMPDTPETVYLPAIRTIGRRPEEVALVLITHADADHIGGNAEVRRLFPNALLACHARDARLASDPALLVAERYDALWEEHRIRYDRSVFDVLESWMGPAEPMDLLLSGGEQFRFRGHEWLSVLELPGHTAGHIGVHHPGERWAVVADAVFGRVQRNADGSPAAPPPYLDVAAYRRTIARLRGLDLELLLTCHYPVMRGAEIADFLDASEAFVDDAERVTEELLREADVPLTLAQAIARAAPRLGPFGSVDDLKYAMLPHLELAESRGLAVRAVEGDVIVWQWAGGPA